MLLPKVAPVEVEALVTLGRCNFCRHVFRGTRWGQQSVLSGCLLAGCGLVASKLRLLAATLSWNKESVANGRSELLTCHNWGQPNGANGTELGRCLCTLL